MMLWPAFAQAQCPALGTITPVSPSCVGGSNGQIQVGLQNVSGLYNITLLQEVGSILVPVQSFANQSANPFVFGGLSASDRYAVFISFPFGNPPPPGCDAFLVSGSVNVADPPPFVPAIGATVVVCAGSSGQLSASGAVSYTWSPADFLSDPNAANPIANPPVTTTYTLTAISANGCVGTATQIVEVTPLPEVIFNLSPTLLCASAAPITLNASPAGGVFSGPGVSSNSFNPAVAGVGIHEIIYSYTENGCNVSRSQSIEVSPTPVLSFALPISSVCLSGSSIALSASPVGGVFSGPGGERYYFQSGGSGSGYTQHCLYIYRKLAVL
ncbi:MAG: hypothetical protein HC912_12905 [Saprospiraceae bacterium]|nr:hypothetical protein [Saprospiraceae bacterium]